ncbi:LuxR C-terminal-related transcriptional regulator [Parasphingopyxis sp.]|uniref:helix-turn-helix transcriptional regulator n=1 Tax=Parasphingopyxis sp. TaxID=1920299 RepID=UPI00260409AD|nr:LuxR C-terminal-related transcriptional regulator [Parasphingopyxis sp.]
MAKPAALLDDAPPLWFSRSKTRAPEPSIALVERTRLLDRLNAGLEKPTTYLVAPAGYGKSILLSQWRSQLIEDGIACAWINVEDSDREIRQFFAYCVLALHEAGLDVGAFKEGAEQGFANMSTTVIGAELLSLIESVPVRFVLILDDFHRAEADEIDAFVRAMQMQCADKLNLVLVSRGWVGSDISAQIASGNATEIQAHELCFTNEEVCAALGGAVEQQAVSELQSKVEGWPVAVQMTKLLGQQRGDLQSAISSIRGDHGHMAEYLANEVIHGLSDDLREFVLKTAILDRFNMALANEICGHNRSHSMMKRLSFLDALIVPVDKDQQWYRYHHLFSECVRDMLKAEDKETFESIHRKAAQWCSDHGHLSEAVSYANAIEAYNISRKVINENGGWAISVSYSAGYFRGLFADIPEEEILKDPLLMMDKAYIYLRSGELQKAVQYCRNVEALVAREGTDPKIEKKRLALCSSIFGRSEVSLEKGNQFLERRLAQVDADAHFTQAFIEVALANEKLILGDFSLSREYAETAIKSLTRAGQRIVMSSAHMAIATGAAYRGKFDLARKHFQDAADLTNEICGEQNTMKFLSGVGRHTIDYWQGIAPEETPTVLKKELFSILDADGGFDDYAVGFDALVHRALSIRDYHEARSLISTLNRANERYGLRRLTRLGELLLLDLYANEDRLAEAELLYFRVKGWHTNEHVHWFLDIMAGYSCARFLAASGFVEPAIKLVDNALEVADTYGVKPYLVRGLLLKAALLDAAGQDDLSKSAFIAALESAAPIGMTQAFPGNGVTRRILGGIDQKLLGRKLSPAAQALLKKISAPDDNDLLTSREKDVLAELSTGNTNKEIARTLGLTENTIKFHVKALYRKLDVSKRVKAVEKARKMGLVP